MRFSDRDRLIAGALQFRRDEPVASIAKQLGLRTHQVQYALSRLLQSKVLRPWVYINPFALGMEEYEVLFTLGAASKRVKSNFDAFLRSHSKVVWFAVLGGDYQYGVRLAVRRNYECVRFLEEVRKRFGGILLRKSFAVLLQFEAYPKRYLSPPNSKVIRSGVQIAPPTLQRKFDRTDYVLLGALVANPTASERDLSLRTGLARGTVRARIAALQKNGVILSRAYLVSASRMGMQAFKALIHSKGLQPQIREQIMKFIATHPQVVNLSTCLGEWDYELGIEVVNPLQASEIVSELYEASGDLISHIELLPVFEQNVSERFAIDGLEA